jgi:hypothetical protein
MISHGTKVLRAGQRAGNNSYNIDFLMRRLSSKSSDVIILIHNSLITVLLDFLTYLSTDVLSPSILIRFSAAAQLSR